MLLFIILFFYSAATTRFIFHSATGFFGDHYLWVTVYGGCDSFESIAVAVLPERRINISYHTTLLCASILLRVVKADIILHETLVTIHHSARMLSLLKSE